MKYTKGNWEATPFEVIIERQTTIADCCLGKRRQPDMSLEEIEANAHLIAAAPVMYEALKRITTIGLSHFNQDDIDMAVKAIAKAEVN